MSNNDREKAIEDLKVVRSIMESCARRQRDTGIYFMIWGLLIPAATVVNYIIVHFERWNLFAPLWGTVIVLGCILSASTGIRRGRGGTMNHADRMQVAVWGGCIGVMAIMMALSFITGDIHLNLIMTVIALLMANAVFISAVMSGTRMLYVFAAGWAVAGIICAFLPQYTAPAVLGSVSFVLSFIPGLILELRYRNERI